MHENREISSVPWSDDQGRSAKAMNRTAGTHALEKSDFAVVTVKQPNKGGQPSAEAVGGRGQTEENIVKTRLPTTPRPKRKAQGLSGSTKRTTEGRDETSP